MVKEQVEEDEVREVHGAQALLLKEIILYAMVSSKYLVAGVGL